VAPLIGARTLFADIDPRTFNMTPDTLRAVLTPRTKVVIVPHINGLMADMPGLLAAAPEVLFIEDAAQAAGATLNGRHAGTWGAYGVFSGNVQKPLQTIDGGWLTTNDDDRARSMRLVSCFGEERVPSVPGAAGAHWARHLGDQGRMHTLAAALGVVGLDELPELLATARHLAKILITVLNDLPGFLPPEIPPGYQSTFHLFRVLLDPVAWEWDGPLVELRDRVLSALIAEGVSAGIWGAFPQPALPVFRRVGGRPRPFVPGEEEQPLRAWDPSRFPVASRVIEGSIVLGRVPHPLQVQTPTLIEHYGRAFTKVWHNRHAVLSLPYERLRLVPEIDPADL
jgi:dTDP-4-amino-4,6-dideoxygalactose transaminase